MPSTFEATSQRPAGRFRVRGVLLGALLAAMLAAGGLLRFTETGRALIDRGQLQESGQQVASWVAARPIRAPAVFLVLYITCSILALPVWWLQILSGYAWGFVAGTAWSLAGHTIGSVVTLYFARWLGAEWVRAKAGKRFDSFQRIARRMGNNGLLVVLSARLLYIVPYGLSNYLFGITHIRARDAAIGTLFGNIPVSAAYVAIGARPALLLDWRFWAAVVTINGLLLLPLAIRLFRTRDSKPPET